MLSIRRTVAMAKSIGAMWLALATCTPDAPLAAQTPASGASQQSSEATAQSALTRLYEEVVVTASARNERLGDARFSNGGHGNSLPGRNIVLGLEWRR